MTEEIKKRLEDAATIETLKDTSKGRNRNDYFISAMADHENGFREGFIAGAEQGYKEAIAQAKKWMQNYFPDELDGNGFEFVKLNAILADFETDMNRLWED